MLGVDDKRGARYTYPLLSVEGVKISYKVNGKSNVAVGDASFEVHPGEKVMLLGPSGCGKSTLLKAVAGFIEPDAGGISFAGRKDLRPGPDRAVGSTPPTRSGSLRRRTSTSTPPRTALSLSDSS